MAERVSVALSLVENEDISFRATKDIDIVLIIESVTAEFGKAFWEYIKEAEFIALDENAVLTPLLIDDEISQFRQSSELKTANMVAVS